MFLMLKKLFCVPVDLKLKKKSLSDIFYDSYYVNFKMYVDYDSAAVKCIILIQYHVWTTEHMWFIDLCVLEVGFQVFMAVCFDLVVL